MKRTFAVTILALLLMTAACSPKIEQALNIAFDDAPVVVDQLEVDGVISADLAGELRVDIPDGAKFGENLIAKLNGIPKKAPDRKAQKLAAWQSGEKDWLAIVSRGHFKLKPKTQRIADSINGLFATAIQIYGGISAQDAPAPVAVPPNLSDKQIEKLLLDRLENALNSLN